MMKSVYLRMALTALLTLFASDLQAGEHQLPDHGLRVNALWPIYPGKKYRLAYRLALHDHPNYRTELVSGLGVSLPEERDTEGRFSESNVSMALRQYFGHAWHSELMGAFGQSQLKNHVTTKRDYRSWDLEFMGLIGYEWKLTNYFSIDLQGGAGKVVQKSNPWPIYKDKTLQTQVGEVLVPIGAIHVTYWFAK